MKSALGYLAVVVPPDIIDYETSHDMTVDEGQNVTLTCTATGLPEPNVEWRREGRKPLMSIGSEESLYCSLVNFFFDNQSSWKANKKLASKNILFVKLFVPYLMPFSTWAPTLPPYIFRVIKLQLFIIGFVCTFEQCEQFFCHALLRLNFIWFFLVHSCVFFFSCSLAALFQLRFSATLMTII